MVLAALKALSVVEKDYEFLLDVDKAHQRIAAYEPVHDLVQKIHAEMKASVLL